MKREITLRMITDATFEDIATIMEALDPNAPFTVAVGPITDVQPATTPAPATTPTPVPAPAPVKPMTGQLRASREHQVRKRYTNDERLVWDDPNGRIDVSATLAKIGKTAQELADMPTKKNSLEFALKRAMVKRGIIPVGKGKANNIHNLHDERLVWDEDNRRINITATLANMGLTVDQLKRMPTKRGTLENAVKAGMHSRDMWKTRGQEQQTALAAADTEATGGEG